MNSESKFTKPLSAGVAAGMCIAAIGFVAMAGFGPGPCMEQGTFVGAFLQKVSLFINSWFYLLYFSALQAHLDGFAALAAGFLAPIIVCVLLSFLLFVAASRDHRLKRAKTLHGLVMGTVVLYLVVSVIPFAVLLLTLT